MELDLSREWRIVVPVGGSGAAGQDGPAAAAARELSSILGRMSGRGPSGGPALGDGTSAEPIIVLDPGSAAADPALVPARAGFSWRASSDRVEILGAGGAGLLRGAYDFLDALGARWVSPGAGGERLPLGPRLDLGVSSRSSDPAALPTTLILGHAVFLKRWADYLPWAARLGYSSVFVHTTPDALAMGAAPQSLYEALRLSIAPLANRLGLRLELGGHGLSSLLPRALFKTEPELFREKEGRRLSDRNLCPSSGRALALVAEAFAARAAAHPEVSVFHAWPDDLPGGGWCSCAACASLSPAAQSLKVSRALAAALTGARPDASLSFLAYHDTQDTVDALAGAEALPHNLELLWAPRLRSWGSALDDRDNELNAASLAAFRASARAWRAAGGGRVAVFEYYEDAVLFKGAVPPLAAVLEGDLAAYRCASDGAPEEAADAVGVLCTGGRLPLSYRPNLALLPKLAAAPTRAPSAADAAPRTAGLAPELLADWARAAYGASAPAMLDYWRELEAAWAIDLDLEEGDTAIYMPESLSSYAADPPADWGDPWAAGLERLAEKRGRCEELFDRLRAAEKALAEAEDDRGEAKEYAISGAVLELDCARLAAYHELASGEARAAADIANIALSASAALRAALRALPRLERREIAFLIEVYYDLRLRAIRRANARSGLRRMLDVWLTSARLGLAALPIARAYEAGGIAPGARRE